LNFINNNLQNAIVIQEASWLAAGSWQLAAAALRNLLLCHLSLVVLSTFHS
jgi:hypothetical protein